MIVEFTTSSCWRSL